MSTGEHGSAPADTPSDVDHVHGWEAMSLEEKLALAAEEAEAGEEDQTIRPLPPYVKVTKPNRPKDGPW